MRLQFKKLQSTAILPTKAHNLQFQDAAFDLFYQDFSGLNESLAIFPQQRIIVSSGLACIIPDGFWIKFHERSGLAAKSGLQVLAGVIDNNYTGEWKVVLYNSGDEPCIIQSGRAMCQFTVEKLIYAEVFEITEERFAYEETFRNRKDAGFGSSDVKSPIYPPPPTPPTPRQIREGIKTVPSRSK